MSALFERAVASEQDREAQRFEKAPRGRRTLPLLAASGLILPLRLANAFLRGIGIVRAGKGARIENHRVKRGRVSRRLKRGKPAEKGKQGD